MFNSKFFSNTFSDLLAEFFERAQAITSTWRLYPQANKFISQQAVAQKSDVSEPVEMLTPENPEAWFIKLVEECLRKYSDVIVLGRSPLAELVGAGCETQVARGRQLQQRLHAAIESLRPAGTRPIGTLTRAWFNYIVLHDAYVIGVRKRDVMARLYISEGTFNRTRRTALRGVAMCLLEGMQRGA
jgi:hypothetical protein